MDETRVKRRQGGRKEKSGSEKRERRANERKRRKEERQGEEMERRASKEEREKRLNCLMGFKTFSSPARMPARASRSPLSGRSRWASSKTDLYAFSSFRWFVMMEWRNVEIDVQRATE